MQVRIKYQNTPAVESGLYSLDKIGFTSPLTGAFCAVCPDETSRGGAAGVRTGACTAAGAVGADIGAEGTEGAGTNSTAAGAVETGITGAGAVLTPAGTEAAAGADFGSSRRNTEPGLTEASATGVVSNSGSVGAAGLEG